MTGFSPIEDIEKEIKEMGYVLITPRKIYPSYYKLKDRTIIKVIVNLNHLIPDIKSPNGFGVNSTNIISSFVPKEKRKPEAYQSYNLSDLQSGIIDEDMEPETLKEDFSVYDLSNGLVLSLKAVASQISKTRYYSVDGEPIYIVNTVPVLKVKKS